LFKEGVEIMGSLISWMLVIGFWSLILGLVGITFEEDRITVVGFAILFLIIFILLIIASVAFLQSQQAWPFTPQ
jgi:hypothetical protein